jgi:hypothetical protein
MIMCAIIGLPAAIAIPNYVTCPEHDIIGDIGTLPTCKLVGMTQQPDSTKAHVLK